MPKTAGSTVNLEGDAALAEPEHSSDFFVIKLFDLVDLQEVVA
jgi:hypothetical protein